MTGQPPPRAGTGLRRLLRRFAPYRRRIALLLLVIALHSAVPGALVFILQKVLDQVLVQRDQVMLMWLPLAIVALYGANGLLSYARGMLSQSIAWAVITQMRHDLMAAMLRQDAAWHQSRATGELISRIGNDTHEIQHGTMGIVDAIQKPLTLLILIGSAVYMNPKLAAIAVVVLPFVAIPIDRFGKRLRRASRDAMDGHADLLSHAHETLLGIRVVQTCGGEGQRAREFDQLIERQRRLKMRAFAAQLIASPVVELIAALGVGAVIWVGGQQVFRGEVQPGALIAFMVALGMLNEPLKRMAQVQSLTQRALAGADSIFAVTDRVPAVQDTGTLVLRAHQVELRFQDVSFDYGDDPVLNNVDLRIGAGRLVALVGASGAGKSTLANLIPRLYDPSQGRLTLNGHDLREYTLASLRQHVAIVSQDVFLFNDTVRANIAFGKPDATFEQVQAAARAANAHDFIAALPQGYDTRIDELGQRLSGGQKQRLSIARAILRDAPLLVLDEATSALDAQSEALVQEALDRLMRHRTVLAIAHRLSTIRNADEILVLDQGHVVERGPHHQLIDQDGAYAQLVARQG